jgi:hypothetical protein
MHYSARMTGSLAVEGGALTSACIRVKCMFNQRDQSRRL